MTQLFGKQTSAAPPIQISKEAKQMDFLGTNFLAFQQPRKTRESYKDFMVATPDQSFSPKSYEVPLKETVMQGDNFFNREGRFAFMYGNAYDHINNIDFGNGNQTITERASGEQRFLNPLFAKKERASGEQRFLNPLFAKKERANGQATNLLHLPDPDDPYTTYGVQQSSDWIIHE